MNKKYLLQIVTSALFIFSFSLPGCKKDSSGGSTTSGYPFSATVDGKAFNANFTNPTIGGPGIAEVVNANGITEVLAVGIQIAGSHDTSIFVVVFPTSISLNKPTSLDPTLNNGAAYSTEVAPGSANYNAYGTNPSYGGSGTITVTEFDQTANVVAGTFSGTFGSSTGTTVKVTDGKFRCIITTVAHPFPSNVKF